MAHAGGCARAIQYATSKFEALDELDQLRKGPAAALKERAHVVIANLRHPEPDVQCAAIGFLKDTFETAELTKHAAAVAALLLSPHAAVRGAALTALQCAAEEGAALAAAPMPAFSLEPGTLVKLAGL